MRFNILSKSVKMKSATESEKRLIDAAVRTFLRYGVRKSTMSITVDELSTM